MPSHRVTGATLSLSIFDVVGQDGDEVGFISHAGLAESGGTQDAAKFPVLDMGPPLHGQGKPNHIEASVMGSASLTDDEERKIRTFVDRHASEHLALREFNTVTAAPKMYCILPHACRFEEVDGRYVRTRFSCAGFVFEAYNKARIKLLDLSSLPMVDFAVIQSAYPSNARSMERNIIKREDLGLVGNGPWPVLLCGYLFHALNRNANAIREEPYVPDAASRRFT